VYLSQSTASLLDATFRLRELGAHEIRGADGPVILFELAGRCSCAAGAPGQMAMVR
jgi:class 3 adenylate cyclase